MNAYSVSIYIIHVSNYLISLFFLKDPSRNHRAYRLTVAKLDPPIIPFMPLLIKGKLGCYQNS